MHKETIEALEAKIGYVFKDKSLPETALTHASYANAHGTESYERLEFFGDSILGFFVTERLFRSHPQEKESALSIMRKRVVSGDALAPVADKLGLGSFQRAAKGVNSKSVRADMFEALIAAVYLDGGAAAAEQFIFRHLGEAIARTAPSADYKTAFKEYCERKGGERRDYRYATVGRSGPVHAPEFTVELYLDGAKIAEATAGSIQEAEQLCAKQWYEARSCASGAN